MEPVPSLRKTALAAALVSAAAVGVYATTLGHGFVLDDGPEVQDNALIGSLSNASRIFVTGSWAGVGATREEVPMWRPVTTLSYAVNRALGGPAPFGFHLTNVLLHAVASVLVLALALHAGVPLGGAGVAGLLFAVMPLHVEAVANVAGRKEILVAVFTLGAVLAHARAVRRGGGALILAPLCVACALLSKESGVSSVAVIVAHDLLLRRDHAVGRKRVLLLYAIYAVEVLGFLIARRAVLGTLVFPSTPFDENPIAAASVPVRLMTAVAVLGRGLSLTVLPYGLSADYSFAAIPPVKGALDPAFLLALAAVTVLCVLVFATRRRFPIGSFAGSFYAVTVFPASNLAVPIGTIFGDRLLYLPSAAVALVAGAGFAIAIRSRWAFLARVGVLLLLAVYATVTSSYSSVWSDPFSLFSAATRAQPESSKAHRMLGGVLVETGRPDEAATEFRRAIQILSNSPAAAVQLAQARVELGVALERSGKIDEAATLYQEVLRADPRQADALWRLGVVRWQRGDRAHAVDLWERAVSANEAHARAMNDLGIAAWLSGDRAGAIDRWRRSTAVDPTFATAWYRLGNALAQTGDQASAISAWEQFLRVEHGRFPDIRREIEGKMLGAPVLP